MSFDKILGQLGGRKFIAWLASSAMMIGGVISEDSWLTLTLVYVGSQAAVDALASLRGKKAPSPELLSVEDKDFNITSDETERPAIERK